MSSASSSERSFHIIEAVPVRGGGDPRRRWPDAVKDELVARALEPGANVSAIARQAGLVPAQLFGWRRAALRNGAAPALVPPRSVDSPASSSSVASTIEIVLDGVVLRVGAEVGDHHPQECPVRWLRRRRQDLGDHCHASPPPK